MNVDLKDYPVVPVRNGMPEPRVVSLDALADKGMGLVTYGLETGDTFVFPATKEELVIVERPVRKNSTAMEYLVGGTKNGKKAWLSVANLRRWDASMKPVHPVAETLRNCENDTVRVEMCLGKTIIGEEKVTYQEAVFVDGVRTDETKARTITKLSFKA
jgi:hypothetical protein